MARIDESRPFVPVNIAVLTVSDTRSTADDRQCGQGSDHSSHYYLPLV